MTPARTRKKPWPRRTGKPRVPEESKAYRCTDCNRKVFWLCDRAGKNGAWTHRDRKLNDDHKPWVRATKADAP